MAKGKRDITAKGKEKEMDKGKARRDKGTEKRAQTNISGKKEGACLNESMGLMK